MGSIEAVRGAALDRAMQIDWANLHDQEDVASKENDVQATKARKHTKKRSPSAGKSKSGRRLRQKAAVTCGSTSQDPPKW